MANFGAESKKQLATCHPVLQLVMNEAIKYFDFSVLEGHRNKEDQNKAYAKGNSQLKWPNGNHNKLPSLACDCSPFPIDWADKVTIYERFAFMAGVITTCFERLQAEGKIGMEWELVWGGDWNDNEDMRDEGKFRDRPHFQIVLKKV